MVKSPIVLGNLQTLDLNHSTVKRADQVTTFTTSMIPSGSSPTTVDVADASQFAVGEFVGVYTSSTNYDLSAHLILAKSGNQLTLGTNFDRAFPAGASLTRVSSIVRNVDAAGNIAMGVQVRNGTLDGNRANNPELNTWYHFADAYAAGDECRLSELRIVESPSEGILVGGTHSIVSGCTIDNCGGNGVHLSGWENVIVENCRITRVNLYRSAWPTHQDGCVSLSQYGATRRGRVCIQSCWFEDAISGVGGINDGESDYCTVQYCTFVGPMEKALGIVAQDGTFGQFVVLGNQFHNAGPLEINLTAPGLGERIQYGQIVGNMFYDSRLKISNATGIVVSGNLFVQNDAAISINLSECSEIVISGNSIQHLASSGSNSYGMLLAGTISNLSSQGNQISVSGGPTNAVGIKVNSGTYSGVAFSDQVRVTGGANGIESNFGITLLNCCVDCASGGGILLQHGGSVSNRTQIAKNCYVRSSGASIRIFSGSYACTVKNNSVKPAVTNSSLAEPSVVVSDNDLIN